MRILLLGEDPTAQQIVDVLYQDHTCTLCRTLEAALITDNGSQQAVVICPNARGNLGGLLQWVADTVPRMHRIVIISNSARPVPQDLPSNLHIFKIQPGTNGSSYAPLQD